MITDKEIEKIRKSLEKSKSKTETAVKGILDILKKLNPLDKADVLGDVFSALRHKDEDGIENYTFESAQKRYVGKQLEKSIPNVLALYKYCESKGYTEENKWEYGGGDRYVCYIPTPKNKVLHFENQNVKFICLVEDERYSKRIHLRKIYKNIYENESWIYMNTLTGKYAENITDIKEALKGERGLDMAISQLGGYSDCLDGVEYPSRIDLDTMKKTDFSVNEDDSCRAFRYGDGRDECYIGSTESLGGNCYVKDYGLLSYCFSDVVFACKQVPKRFKTMIKRDETLEDLLDS